MYARYAQTKTRELYYLRKIVTEDTSTFSKLVEAGTEDPGSNQVCQIFLGTRYKNRKKCTK
jgi:hypothetical protein